MSTESSKIRAIERRLERLEKTVAELKEAVGILPKRINPLSSEIIVLTDFDKSVLKVFMTSKDELLSNSKISATLSVDHVKTWRSLKRIMRVSKRVWGFPLVIFDPTFKKWSLNRTDYEIVEEEKKDE